MAGTGAVVLGDADGWCLNGNCTGNEQEPGQSVIC